MTSESNKAERATARWRQTLEQVGQDLIFLAVLVGIMQVTRLILVWAFRSRLEETTGLLEVFRAALRGLQYDVSVATYLSLPCLAVTFLCLFGDARTAATWVRRVWSTIVIPTLILAGIIDGIYVGEFHQQFSHFMFVAGEGYLRPVLKTAWSEYHLGPFLLLFAFLSVVTIYGFNRLRRRDLHLQSRVISSTQPPAIRIICMACFGGLLFLSARGSIERRPIQTKDADATPDTVMNSLVPNAPFALKNAISIHLKMKSSRGLAHFLGDSTLRDAASELHGTPVDSVDDATRRTTSGPKIKRPSHIFFIVMESADGWAMKDEFAGMHLADEMRKIAKNGVAASFFASSGPGSIESIASLLTGHPDVGVSTNYRINSRQTFATSLAPQMAAIGYEPCFYKGSFLTFQRYGEFATEQGFTSVTGASQIGQEMGAKMNEWGVDDDVLFRSIESNVPDHSTFNFIVSTTYHPPYDLDVFALGYPVTSPPTDLAAPCSTCTPKFLQTVGHAWFADRALGEFVARTSKAHPEALFIITADHWSRRFINERPTFELKTEIPLIMFGPGVLEGFVPDSFFGSHLDIAPTLIELIAPEGHHYNSFGRDMFAAEESPFSIAANGLMGDGFMVSHDGRRGFRWDDDATDPSMTEEMAAWGRSLQSLAWWRIMRQSDFLAEDLAKESPKNNPARHPKAEKIQEPSPEIGS
jgi:phosphoglycerol transferase MdoB-like AlkP superfamily enzyme